MLNLTIPIGGPSKLCENLLQETCGSSIVLLDSVIYWHCMLGKHHYSRLYFYVFIFSSKCRSYHC